MLSGLGLMGLSNLHQMNGIKSVLEPPSTQSPLFFHYDLQSVLAIRPRHDGHVGRRRILWRPITAGESKANISGGWCARSGSV